MGCAGGSVVVHDDSLIGYNFGPAHPMNPVRVDLDDPRLTRSLGLLDGSASEGGRGPRCDR